ncbi:MAG TPA: endonuclease, partial [Clostridiales bacterium]|nr:endonuclease [Clostridiales bacterium]
MTDDKLIEDIYIKLLDYYGPQSWWPADSPFEVMLGAILTQNTNWNNVEKALDNLKPYMQPQIIYAMDMDKLKVLIKPSGFYNIKAERIKNFLEWFKGYNFSLERLKQIDMYTLRRELLTISGIGKETADSILLYALNMPI